MEKYTKMVKGTKVQQVAKVIILCILCFILFNCAYLDGKVGTRTYTWSVQQVEQVKKIGNIEECPEGKSAIAIAAQMTDGGATVTIWCQ